MKIRRPAFALLFFALIVLSFQPTFGADAKWTSVRSKNFHLVGDASEKDIRRVAAKLEQFRETFRQLFPGIKISSPVSTNVVVFKNGQSYRPFKPKGADGGSDEGIAGYFQPGEDVNYITLAVDGRIEETLGTIYHEFVHFLLETNFGKSALPPWFNEGLAEYYQTFAIENDQMVTLGKIQNAHLQVLRQQPLIPLKTFFAIDNYSLHQNGNHSRSVFYAQSWALIHYLIQGNAGTGRANLDKFLKQLLDGADAETAFREIFGAEYAATEIALKKYVEQRSFQATLVTLPKKLQFDAEMVSGGMSDAQANAYLGDLLYHTNEFAEAEAYLSKALAADPKLGIAHSSMGLVKMRQRNFAAAKQHLEAAIRDDSKNHLAHYGYAYVLSRESMDELGYVESFPADAAAKIRFSLKQAMTLKPDFGESYRLYAFVSMVNGEQLDEAAAMLEKVMAAQPGNEQFMLLSAQVLLRQEKLDYANAMAQKLMKFATLPEVRTAAETIVKTIRAYKDSIAAVVKQQQAALQISVDRLPLILKRSKLSEKEVRDIDEDRVLNNLNRLLPRLDPGGKHAVGRITGVSCTDGGVIFTVKAGDESLQLTSRDFQGLKLNVLIEGTSTFQVGCGSDLRSVMAVVSYTPPAAGVRARAMLHAITFVPENFRLKTPEELANARIVIIEDDLRGTAQETAEIKAAAMKERIENLLASLRKPLAGELQILGVLQKVQCSEQGFILKISSTSGDVQVSAASAAELTVTAFTPDGEGIRIACGVTPPPVKALVTYAPAAEGSLTGSVKAIEFVPDAFRLP